MQNVLVLKDSQKSEIIDYLHNFLKLWQMVK